MSGPAGTAASGPAFARDRPAVCLAALALASMGALLPARAAADGVEIAPMACPRGSERDADHVGPYCAPVACSERDDCPDDQSCEDVALCVEDVERSRYGRPPHTITVAHSECAADGRCATGRCERALRCVPATAPSCGCAAAGASAGRLHPSLFVGIAAIAIAALGRRRGRARSARARGAAERHRWTWSPGGRAWAATLALLGLACSGAAEAPRTPVSPSSTATTATPRPATSPCGADAECRMESAAGCSCIPALASSPPGPGCPHPCVVAPCWDREPFCDLSTHACGVRAVPADATAPLADFTFSYAVTDFGARLHEHPTLVAHADGLLELTAARTGEVLSSTRIALADLDRLARLLAAPGLTELRGSELEGEGSRISIALASPTRSFSVSFGDEPPPAVEPLLVEAHRLRDLASASAPATAR